MKILSKKKSYIRRYIEPSHSFLLVHIFLVLLPNIYIYLTGFYSNRWVTLSSYQYYQASETAMISTSFFFMFFILGLVFIRKIIPRNKQYFFNKKIIQDTHIIIPSNNFSILYLCKKNQLILITAIISSAFIWINIIYGGMDKILAFGSDLSPREYRFMGFDENRYLTAILQIARRLILPFALLYMFLINKYKKVYSNLLMAYLITTLILGVIITLDRAPIMMMIIMVAYIKYTTMRNRYKLTYLIPILIGIIIITGGISSYIQHNIQTFSPLDIIKTGSEFILNRAFLAPNYVPIELSYGMFTFESEKLLLKHTRILALFTGNYVGSTNDLSIYVSPVGATADIWRNLGLFGIIFISFLMGIFFGKLDILIKMTDPIIQIAMSFTAITLSFYLLYGTFFSQGVFLQIFFLYFGLKFFIKRTKAVKIN